MPASKGASVVMSTGNATLDAVGAASGAATVELAVEWIVYLVIIIVITALRTYARASIPGRSGFGWDDYLVWIAVVRSRLSLKIPPFHSINCMRPSLLLTVYRSGTLSSLPRST